MKFVWKINALRTPSLYRPTPRGTPSSKQPSHVFAETLSTILLIQSTPRPQPPIPSISHLLSSLPSEFQPHPASTEPAGSPQISLGHVLPSVSKRVGMRILAGEYVDFADLPPAKGKVKSLPAPEGSVIIVQAYDLLQQKG